MLCFEPTHVAWSPLHFCSMQKNHQAHMQRLSVSRLCSMARRHCFSPERGQLQKHLKFSNCLQHLRSSMPHLVCETSSHYLFHHFLEQIKPAL